MPSKTETEFAEFDSNSVWNEVYQRLKNEASLTTLGDEFSTKLARDPDNRRKNRYRDVSPYDHSRVVLSGDPDYINASFLEIPEAGRKYILTQGPLDHTMSDLWQMTWEQNTKAIVMLNRVIEKGTLKCSQYWPLGSKYGYEDDMYFPSCGLRVTLSSEEDFQHFSLRSLELAHLESGKKREVLHFHYTTWPDFGVPSSPDVFLQFLHAVRESGSLSPDVGPAIIHCSAGIGRSGVFSLVDSSLIVVENDKSLENVSVRDMLIRMRSFRMGLVQTADQLRFSYLAILQGSQAILKGSGLESLESQNHYEGVPPPPPQRSSSLQPSSKSEMSEVTPNTLDLPDTLDEEPPPLPPKKNSPFQRQSGWDGDTATDDGMSDDDDEEFDKLIDRDEDKENIGDNLGADDNDSESDNELQRTQLRHRIREQRKQQTLQKIQEMKDKQRRSERWRPYRSFFTNSMYIGMAVLVGVTGVIVYKYLL